MAGFRVRHTLATKLVNEPVAAPDEKNLTKAIARYGRGDRGRAGPGQNRRRFPHPRPAAASSHASDLSARIRSKDRRPIRLMAGLLLT